MAAPRARTASLSRLRRGIDRCDRRLLPLPAARGRLVREVAAVRESPRAAFVDDELRERRRRRAPRKGRTR